VPRRDCSARRGRSSTPAHHAAGGDHHATRRVAQQQEDLAREGALEAPLRLDRRPHHHELGAALGRDARYLLAEAPGPCADDLLPDADAVRARNSGRGLQPFLQIGQLAVHVRVERELVLDDERRDEDDPGAAVGRETTGEVERVLGLLLIEQRHDNTAVGDRARPAREAPRSVGQHSDVRHPHRNRW
jgi:hypothetical protein